MWGRTNFICVGQNFSENFCPRILKIFVLGPKIYLIGQKFFILGQFFSRTKIPVTVRSY